VLRFASLRILLDYRPALRERTGVGEFVHQLARALARTGTEEVTVLSASWKDRPTPAAARDLTGVRIVDRRIPVRGLTWAWNRLGWPPAEWLAGPQDVWHSPTPLLIPARSGARVVTIHDLHFLQHADDVEAEMRRDFPVLVSEHAHRADHIVVPSQHVANEVARQLAIPAERITVCRLGAPAWADEVAARRELARGGPPAERSPYLLFVGTLEPRKNIGGLLSAYARLRTGRPDAPELILAGGAKPAVAGELARLNEPPLAGHVTALGYVADERRRELYLGAAVLVLPSFDEGFGLPVLEAMACGVPVVISNRGALPELTGDAAAPVDPDDVEGLARAMERALEPQVAQELAARGRQRAARHSWDAAAAAAREAYRKALARRAGPAAWERRVPAR
jgi:glycosyltransferase involved in cell wall biosynthesis